MTDIAITIIIAIAGLLAVKLVLLELVHWRPGSSWFVLTSALQELARAAVAKLVPPDIEPAVPMPDNISQLINRWGEQWAREDEEKYVRGLFKTHKDWDVVHRMLLTEDKPSG